MYVDDGGAEQGPFATAKLISWLSRGLLTTERQVRPAAGGELRDMATWPEFAAAVAGGAVPVEPPAVDAATSLEAEGAPVVTAA